MFNENKSNGRNNHTNNFKERKERTVAGTRGRVPASFSISIFLQLLFLFFHWNLSRWLYSWWTLLLLLVFIPLLMTIILGVFLQHCVNHFRCCYISRCKFILLCWFSVTLGFTLLNISTHSCNYKISSH